MVFDRTAASAEAVGVPAIHNFQVAYPEGRTYLLPGETALVTARITDPDVEEVEVIAGLRQMDYDAGWSISGSGSSYQVTAPMA